ncbi:haloalkane dehalogenase [Streptomyces sp. NPDC047022]|uniref:haloalkane dehalogenase n=1 Tax=Streptomyces sp. NPDC047022 TaxID=3155737 RepID=UPI0033D313CF
MRVLRTPDHCFASLPDWPYRPRYLDVPPLDGSSGRLRVHYVDEGPPRAAPVLLLHGEPTWSYLYRHIIAGLVDRGHRVLAPDLVGFGRSDKPASQSDHTFERHVAWMSHALFKGLNLSDVTLFGQDWGGMIGLRLVAESPERFARLVLANTGLPTGDTKPPDPFLAWQEFAKSVPVFDAGAVVGFGTLNPVDPAVRAAYNAPFPEEGYQAGARALPSLVPTDPDDPAAADQRRAWRSFADFRRPVLTAFSDGDPITRGGEERFLAVFPLARRTTVSNAGHFLQEDAADRVVDVIASFIEEVP